MKISPVSWLLLLLLTSYHLDFSTTCRADQIDNLNMLLKSRKSNNPPRSEPWAEEIEGVDNAKEFTPVYVGAQDGLMEADKIASLPGQPEGVDFDQYGGYVTVDPKAGRALFYYFVESPKDSSTKPLLLWLNGGPGCSSLIGAMEELGPFRVNNDNKTLFRNNYSWNEVANVIFLESPAGVGYSYSNTSSDYAKAGDKMTAQDSYTFLVNWLERFPHYKTRDFYITGESYAGHYVPQLAYTILTKNKVTNQTVINLKGIAIGNAWIDDNTSTQGILDYFWTHALNSDETYEAIHKHCDFVTGNYSDTCNQYQNKGWDEIGDVDVYNIYAPICLDPSPKPGVPDSVKNFDPCSGYYMLSYLNIPEVQKAFHAKTTKWSGCGNLGWTDSPTTVLPTIKQLIASGIRLWIYSGDIDGRVPITASRYSVKLLKLPVQTPWRPWYLNKEVGGYVVGYEGAVLATVRGAGHTVPSYQPERALLMISSFLEGKLLPSS